MNGQDWRDLLIIVVVVAVVAAIVAWLRRPRAGTYAAPLAYGLDFSWEQPTPQAILDAGYTFVCRYHSWSTSGKNLTAAEADSYQANGIGICSNWEYYANAPAYGWPQGIEDATEAARQHAGDGGGPDDPIYFSVDWDAQDWELPIVGEYFKAVASIVGLARTGAYGSYRVIRYLFDKGLITYGWQTYAWSYGSWDKRAQLRQVQNGITVGGCTVDRNEAWADDFGQWGGGARPPEMGDSAVILNDPNNPGRLDLFYVGRDGQVWHRWYPSGGMTSMWNDKGSHENLGGYIIPGTLTAQWAHDGSGINIGGLGQPDDGVSPPSGCGQYWGYWLGRSGEKSGWGSMNGVYGLYPGSARPAGRSGL